MPDRTFTPIAFDEWELRATDVGEFDLIINTDLFGIVRLANLLSCPDERRPSAPLSEDADPEAILRHWVGRPGVRLILWTKYGRFNALGIIRVTRPAISVAPLEAFWCEDQETGGHVLVPGFQVEDAIFGGPGVPGLEHDALMSAVKEIT